MNTAPNPSFNPDEGFRFLYLFDGPQVFLKSNQAVQILEPDAEDYFSRIFAAGSSISAVNQVAVNNFIVGCKADGIWSAIKASCLLAGPDTLAGALVPLVGPAPTNFNFVAGDYNRVTGLKGNGSNKGLITNVTSSVTPQNDHHLSVWVRERASSNSSSYLASDLVGNSTAIYGFPVSTSLEIRSSSSLASVISSAIPNNGFVGFSRKLTTEVEYRTSINSGIILLESFPPSITTYRVFSRSTTAYSNARLSYYSIGESLDLAALDARLTTYMASIQ
jgi:hypothetical protein